MFCPKTRQAANRETFARENLHQALEHRMIQPGARRKGTLICKDCGSSDLCRIDQRSGIVAAIMRYRGRKPFQCRACGWICYRPARRTQYSTLPFPGELPFPVEGELGEGELGEGEKAEPGSGANLLKLSSAFGSASEHCDIVKGVRAPENPAGAAGLKAEDHSIRTWRRLVARDSAEAAAGISRHTNADRE